MPLFGPPNVEKLKAKGDVQRLIKALNYKKDAIIRQSAAEALGQIGDAQAVESLIAALKDEDKNVRQVAVRALGRIGDARAVEPLIAALKDTDNNVREAAAEALEQVGGARTVELLLAAIKDEARHASESSISAWGADRDVLVKIGTAAVEPLVIALKDEHRYVRTAAAEVLGQIRDARAVEPLVAALKDEHRYVRGRVAVALGQIGDPRAVEPLVAALKDKNGSVRKNAVEALDSLGWQPANDTQRAFQAVALEDWEQVRSLGPVTVEPLVALTTDIWRSMTAIEKLQELIERAATSIASEDLQAVAHLKNVTKVKFSHSDCGMEYPDGTEPADCSRVKQLARQELIRRGLEA